MERTWCIVLCVQVIPMDNCIDDVVDGERLVAVGPGSRTEHYFAIR